MVHNKQKIAKMNSPYFDREFGNDTEFDYGEGGQDDHEDDDNDRGSGAPTAAVAASPTAVAASATAVAASASAGTSNRNWSAAEHIKMLTAILAVSILMLKS
jgi:hypothetical protein